MWKVLQISLCLTTVSLCLLLLREVPRIFRERSPQARCANYEFIFGGNPTCCEAASDQLKKTRVCIAWVFQGHRESFSGSLYCLSRFQNFVKTRTHALTHSTKKSHALPQRQRLVIATLVHTLSRD